MDCPGENAPDQQEDDLLFEQFFSEWGEQKKMASLMGVSRATVARQIKEHDEYHPSDYHRGRRLAYAAGFRGDEKGERLKEGLDKAFEAGRRDAGHGGKARQVEGASVLHCCMNYAAAYMKDETEELRALNLLIAEATARRDALLAGEGRADVEQISDRRARA
jgi:hypothetical protein